MHREVAWAHIERMLSAPPLNACCMPDAHWIASAVSTNLSGRRSCSMALSLRCHAKGVKNLCPWAFDELYNSGSVPFEHSVLRMAMAIERGIA